MNDLSSVCSCTSAFPPSRSASGLDMCEESTWFRRLEDKHSLVASQRKPSFTRRVRQLVTHCYKSRHSNSRRRCSGSALRGGDQSGPLRCQLGRRELCHLRQHRLSRPHRPVNCHITAMLADKPSLLRRMTRISINCSAWSSTVHWCVKNKEKVNSRPELPAPAKSRWMASLAPSGRQGF